MYETAEIAFVLSRLCGADTVAQVRSVSADEVDDAPEQLVRASAATMPSAATAEALRAGIEVVMSRR
ncbi:hypothetical protein GCM10027421_29690 [Microbacterium shaanxiense]